METGGTLEVVPGWESQELVETSGIAFTDRVPTISMWNTAHAGQRMDAMLVEELHLRFAFQ